MGLPVVMLVLLAVAIAKSHFGSAGLFTVGLISGLTDMDAITLSAAQMAGAGKIDPRAAWQTITIAALANFAFKFAIVATLGPSALTRRIGAAFGSTVVGGLLILWLWPA